MGLLSGFVISLWVGIGSQIYPPLPERTKPLSLSTAGCNISTGNLTSTVFPLTTVFSTPGAERYVSSSNAVTKHVFFFFLKKHKHLQTTWVTITIFSGLSTTLFEMQQFSLIFFPYQTEVCLSYSTTEVKVNLPIDLKSFSSIFEFKGLECLTVDYSFKQRYHL